MSMFPNANRGSHLEYAAPSADSVAITTFFNAVYAWMAAGLGLTALVAWYISTQPDIMRMFIGGPLMWVCLIAEVALVFTIASAVNRLSATAATALFLLYAALNGLTLSVIFVIYAHALLASAFIVTAGMFGAMSVYGHVTKTDLTRFGNLLFMALIGIVLATVVSYFWHNTVLGLIINYVGVLVFVGLTAYDTQRLRQLAIQTQGNAAFAARMSVNGALSLYLDFINMFLFMLRILSDRR